MFQVYNSIFTKFRKVHISSSTKSLPKEMNLYQVHLHKTIFFLVSSSTKPVGIVSWMHLQLQNTSWNLECNLNLLLWNLVADNRAGSGLVSCWLVTASQHPISSQCLQFSVNLHLVWFLGARLAQNQSVSKML